MASETQRRATLNEPPADIAGTSTPKGQNCKVRPFQEKVVQLILYSAIAVRLLVAVGCGRGKTLPLQLIGAQTETPTSMVIVVPSQMLRSEYGRRMREAGVAVILHGGDEANATQEFADRFFACEYPGVLVTTRSKLGEAASRGGLMHWATCETDVKRVLVFDEIQERATDVAEILRWLPEEQVSTVLLTGTPSPFVAAIAERSAHQVILDEEATLIRHDLRCRIERVGGRFYQKAREARAAEVVREMPGVRIVYVESKDRCNRIADLLRGGNTEVFEYHSGVSPQDKGEVRRRLRTAGGSDDVIVVATSALGAGLDIPEVHGVVLVDHYDPVLSCQLALRVRRSGTSPAEPHGTVSAPDVVAIVSEDSFEPWTKDVSSDREPAAIGRDLLGRFVQAGSTTVNPGSYPARGDDEIRARALSWLIRAGYVNDQGQGVGAVNWLSPNDSRQTGPWSAEETILYAQARLRGEVAWLPDGADRRQESHRELSWNTDYSVEGVAAELGDRALQALGEITQAGASIQATDCLVEWWTSNIRYAEHDAEACITCARKPGSPGALTERTLG